MAKVKYYFNTKNLKYERILYPSFIIFLPYFLIIVGIGLVLWFYYIDKTLLGQNSSYIIAGLLMAGLGIGIILYNYLEGKSYKQNQDLLGKDISEGVHTVLQEFLSKQRDEVKNILDDNKSFSEEIKKEVQEIARIQFNEQNTKQIFASLNESFSKNITKEFFQELSDKITIELTNEKRSRLNNLLQEFNSIKARLNNEIGNLGRKANLNLVIGSLVTIVALALLGFIVFQNLQPYTNYIEIIYHYIPRLSLIIFVEVFAYFFLKLYKANLDDLKYYQNELTTVEIKLVSITTAINFGQDVDISNITIELSKTERNFLLRKGETTVEIEKSKIDKSEFKELIKAISQIVKAKKENFD